jgi:hypothetical protein
VKPNTLPATLSEVQEEKKVKNLSVLTLPYLKVKVLEVKPFK